jgi:hypothetical protein
MNEQETSRKWDIWYSEEELALAHWIRYQMERT